MLRVNKQEVKEMLLAGKTQGEIAEKFQTSKQNVSLWRKRWFPELTRKDWGASKRAILKAPPPTDRPYLRHEDEISRAKSLFFSRKKQNAKCKKWDFTITFQDVVWNDVCPILDIPINWENDIRGENSPSMDRKDPKLGYVAGNVEIVSWRANRIKNDGTAEEHLRIAEYMKKSK